MAELALEQELQEHLLEQRSSLDDVDAALACDQTNEELLQIRGELFAAITAAEESLHHLRQARILHVVEPQAHPSAVNSSPDSDDLSGDKAVTRGDSDGEGVHQAEGLTYLAGSKCRFRHTDGRWYNGKVIGVIERGIAKVSFLTPTAEKMQICRFYLQQRCRFGGTCRLSHGLEIPLSALRQFISPDLDSVPLGSTVLACAYSEDSSLGLWRPAELEAWDSKLKHGRVVFISDGQRVDVGLETLALSEHAISDEESDSSDSESEDDVSEQQISHMDAVHATFNLGALPTGPQTETVTFARWEKHTRGVASKLMAGMGYREGMGLGRDGQGIVDPVQAKVLPRHQSLEFAHDSGATGKEIESLVKKKKSRGGKRKRDKKWAAAAVAGKGEEERRPNVFGFINNQLAGKQGKVDATSKDMPESGSASKKVRVGRSSLVFQEEELNELRTKVSKLEEMAKRNRKEKVVYEAVLRKLEEARKAVSEAEAAHATATHSIHSKEKEKKWLRF